MKQMMYEGKAKQVFQSENMNEVYIYYKDDATAFNGIKKEQIKDKGVYNNAITSLFYTYLNQQQIPTHFIRQSDERTSLCQKVEIIPLEVIVRNVVAGSLSKRLGLEEGQVIAQPLIELCFKDDELGDPLINEEHALLLGACTKEELGTIDKLAREINHWITQLCTKAGLILVDFKLEFGRTHDGRIVLADEISCDTCRFWDVETKEKLDKDRFRRDLGNVIEAYEEVYRRLVEVC